jgi:hypothetical protein
MCFIRSRGEAPLMDLRTPPHLLVQNRLPEARKDRVIVTYFAPFTFTLIHVKIARQLSASVSGFARIDHRQKFIIFFVAVE